MQKFTDKTLMPFGKHKGTALANIPANSLIWYYENTQLSAPLKIYIEENMDALKAEVKRSSKFNAR